MARRSAEAPRGPRRGARRARRPRRGRVRRARRGVPGSEDARQAARPHPAHDVALPLAARGRRAARRRARRRARARPLQGAPRPRAARRVGGRYGRSRAHRGRRAQELGRGAARDRVRGRARRPARGPRAARRGRGRPRAGLFAARARRRRVAARAEYLTRSVSHSPTSGVRRSSARSASSRSRTAPRTSAACSRRSDRRTGASARRRSSSSRRAHVPVTPARERNARPEVVETRADVRELLRLLGDDLGDEERVARGARFLGATPKTREEALAALIDDRDETLATVAAYYALELDDQGLLKRVDAALVKPADAARRVVARARACVAPRPAGGSWLKSRTPLGCLRHLPASPRPTRSSASSSGGSSCASSCPWRRARPPRSSRVRCATRASRRAT